MKLLDLYEEAPEGLSYDKALGLGAKIGKALQQHKANTKKNVNPWFNKTLPSRKGINSTDASPHPFKPRHRKFFGIDHPARPY